MGEVKADHPWVTDWFTSDQLEVIASRIGSQRPAGIVMNLARMEMYNGGKKRVGRRSEIRAALGISGSADKQFFEAVEECKGRIVSASGGSRITKKVKS